MYYAENPETGEKGIFISLSEFLPYRLAGWGGTEDFNEAADNRLRALENTPDQVLKYMAPMNKTGEDARTELHRRQENTNV